MISGTNSSIYRFERVSKLSFYPSARNNLSKNYTRIKRKKVSLPCFVHETWKRERRGLKLAMEETMHCLLGHLLSFQPRNLPSPPHHRRSSGLEEALQDPLFRRCRRFRASWHVSLHPRAHPRAFWPLSPLSLYLSTLYFLEGGPSSLLNVEIVLDFALILFDFSFPLFLCLKWSRRTRVSRRRSDF